MDVNERIERFQELVRQDPDNDMAHFTLGGAYAQADRPADAAECYIRCTELNESMSKAFQLAGASLIAAGETERAAEVLAKGFAVASEHGDMMPKNAMADLLTQIGAPVPKQEKVKAEVVDAGFVCKKTGRPGSPIARVPFRTGVGAWIQENLSDETWKEWIALGTKVINELRLDLSKDEHSLVYDYAMRRYIGLDDETFKARMEGAEPQRPSEEYTDIVDQMLERINQMEQYKGEAHQNLR